MTRRPARQKRLRSSPGQQYLLDTERPCQLCGRRLRDDLSIRRGYGTHCWRRVQRKRKEEDA